MVNPAGNPRAISLSTYLAALFISAVIFAAGIYVGHVMETGNIAALSTSIDSANNKMDSVEMLYLMGEDSPAICPVYRDELQNLDAQTEQLGYQISYMEDKGTSDPDLKRQYFMLEANAYMLSQKVLAKCEQANYSTVLYFYNNSNCPNCTQQGYELLDVKKQLGDGLRVYSFDGGLGSDIVDMLELRYNVTTYPSLVIDGNQTYPGFRTGDWIGAQLNATVQNMGTANSTDPNAGAAATTRIG